MVTNKSRHFLRRQEILSALKHCDRDSEKIRILVDMVVKQENEIAELRENYIQLLHTKKPTNYDVF